MTVGTRHGPSVRLVTAIEAWRSRIAVLVARIVRSPELRGEIGWVVVSKAAELALSFWLLKLLTSRLGKAGFGEYNLADTAVFLGACILLTPVHESYLRDYHGSDGTSERRAAGMFLLRWYAIATIAVALGSGLFGREIATWFELAPWTPLAAGLVFAFERWRYLGQDVLNIRRKRRAWALFNVAYAATMIASISAAVSIGPATAPAALFAYAATSGLFALLVAVPLVRDVLRAPRGAPTRLSRMVVVFGLPYAALFLFHWIQSFGDRYLVKALLDAESVGLYVAAYQVCGIPYALMGRITHDLLTPIAYQRGRDATQAAQLWAADRVLIAGIAVQLCVGTAMLGCYALFGQRLLTLLTDERFVVPGTTLVALAGARFAQSVAQEIQPIFAVHHQAQTMLWFRMLGAAFTLAICWMTIPRYGVSGAAIGTLIALVAYLLVLVVGPKGCWWLVAEVRRN